MTGAPSYYTLDELVTQRQNAVNFGMPVADLEAEIEAQAKYEAGKPVNTRPFDQDVD